jgi:hypothetical protein
VAGVEAAIWAETVRDFDDLSFLLLPGLAGVARKGMGASTGHGRVVTIKEVVDHVVAQTPYVSSHVNSLTLVPMHPDGFITSPEPWQDKYVSRWDLDGVSGLIAVDDRGNSIALVALCRGLALRRDV